MQNTRMMKRLFTLLGCLLVAQAMLLAGSKLPKSPDYGK